jgi:hypothetical protein
MLAALRQLEAVELELPGRNSSNWEAEDMLLLLSSLRYARSTCIKVLQEDRDVDCLLKAAVSKMRVQGVLADWAPIPAGAVSELPKGAVKIPYRLRFETLAGVAQGLLEDADDAADGDDGDRDDVDDGGDDGGVIGSDDGSVDGSEEGDGGEDEVPPMAEI